MGQVLVKTDDGWKPSIPYVKTANGWQKVRAVSRKTNSTTWATVQQIDFLPPGKPTIVVETVPPSNGVPGKLRITVTAPADTDTTSVRVKVGTSKSINNDYDANYVSSPDGNDASWSDWKIAPGQTRSKLWPPTKSQVQGDRNYVVTAWAYDNTRNVSEPETNTHYTSFITIRVPTASTTTIACTDSVAFRRSNRTYFGDDDLLRCGGPNNWYGAWFYSTRLAAAVKNADKINSMSIQIQRHTTVGRDGPQQFHVFCHDYEGQRTSDLIDHIVHLQDLRTFSLRRGQIASFDIPAGWFPEILSGKIKGFGVYSQTSSAGPNDVYNAAFYGKGTTSGQLTLEVVK